MERNIQERNYGVDFLRMVSMLMIVINHIFRFGGAYADSSGINRIVIVCLDVLCLCAVNCFALISGYFGVKAKHRYSSIISLWILVFFYGCVFLSAFALISSNKISTEIVFQSVFPVLSNRYWYFTSYFALYFLMPLLNKGVQNLSDTQLRNTCIAIVALFSVLSTISNFWNASIFGLEFGYSVIWLIALYIIGAYLNRCGNSLFKKHKIRNWLFIYAIGDALTILSKLIIEFMCSRLGFNNSGGGELFQYNSPTILLESIGLFMAFINLRLSQRMIKAVSFLSPLAFSVYIIHLNKLVLSECFFDRFIFITKLPFYLVPFVVVISGVVVYLICTLVDLFRKYLFKIMKIEQFSHWLERCGRALLERLPL